MCVVYENVNVLDFLNQKLMINYTCTLYEHNLVEMPGTYFPSGYLQCIDSATVSLVQKYSLQIQTLSYSQAIVPLMATQPAPEGCAVAIASDRCTVNMMLKVRGDPF